MTRRFALSTLPIFGILLLAASLATAADDYLKLVPDSAWGFVAVNRPAEVDAKIQALASEMQLPIPPLMAQLKQLSGIKEGFDEKGTFVTLYLPPGNDGAKPVPIQLIPVTDYAKFLAQLKPENATDEVTKFKFSDQEFCIRHLGNYAVLAESAHREALEKTIKLASESSAALKPWAAWISTHDAAGVLMQPGVKDLSAKAQTWLSTMKMVLGQAGEQGKQAAAAFGMYEKFLQSAEKEVSAAGIGLQLDKQNVLRVTSRTLMLPEGNWTKFIAKVPSSKENLLKGLPGGSFVVAGGGATSDTMVDEMIKSSINMMKSMPDFYGLSNEQIDKLSELAAPKFKGVRSMSMALGAGEIGDPLYSNVLAIIRVDNSAKFLESYEQYFHQYNEVIKGSKSLIMQPIEIEKCEIAGKSSLQGTSKIPEPPAGQKPPNYDKMMESMFGAGDKITFWFVPADEHTIMMGYITKKPLEQAIASFNRNKPGLENDAEVQKTAALLSSDAPAVGYLSPQGTIEFFKRMLPAILPPGVPFPVNIPDFPQTPPVGLAVQTAPNELQTTLVVPAEVLKAIGQYVKHIRGMSGNNVTMN